MPPLSRLALLPLALSLAACGSQQGGPPADLPVTVDLAPVSIEAILETVPAVGTLEPDESVEIRPEVSGVVTGIHFEEGQRVEKGSLLIVLDARKQEARVREVEAALELAKANFERAQKLLADRTVSQEEFDQTASRLAADEAVVALERARLKDMTITAPFTGVIGRRQVSIGQFINVGTTLATIYAMDTLKIAFNVPERYLGRIKLGQEVQVTVTPFPDRIFTAKISFISPQVDANTRTLSALAELDNRKGELKPGLFANVRTVLDQRENAMTIPESAAFLIGDDLTVYVEKDGKAQIRTIKGGIRLDGRLEVLEGLSPSERVILGDSRKLGDGRTLNVRNAPPAPGPAVAVGQPEKPPGT
jgi:membrane fusion protein (multidrug efflux system)